MTGIVEYCIIYLRYVLQDKTKIMKGSITMNKFKKMLTVIMAVAMLLSISTCLSIPAAAASAPEIVKDGLVAWYDGANNSNGEQDHDATVWKDLTGNGNHLQMRVNETNYWTDNAYHIDASSYYFPDAVKDVINGETYTIEFVAGELTFAATNWITLMCSDNDELSIFVRVPNGTDTETNFEYKYNDKNSDRPKIDNGAETINNATVAITFDLSDPLYGECIVYVNGVAMGMGVPQHTNIADTVSFGHENPQRAWSGDIHGFRFYNRALTPEEVMANSDADQRKYREGNYYPPTEEYDGSGEDIMGGLTGDFKNTVIPMMEELDLIPTEGYYGTASIIDPQMYNKEEWANVRFIRTKDLDLDNGNPRKPGFYINYQKYCRRTGLENLSADDVQYIVAKVRAEGTVGDMTLHVCSGGYNSFFEVAATESYFFGFEDTTETQYMLYELNGAYTGNINNLYFEFQEMETDAVVYVEEVCLFTDAEAAFAYAGIEEETKAPVTQAPETEPETEAPETEAPETQAPETEVPAESGCGSVIGFSAVAILAAGAAFVALKKKD